VRLARNLLASCFLDAGVVAAADSTPNEQACINLLMDTTWPAVRVASKNYTEVSLNTLTFTFSEPVRGFSVFTLNASGADVVSVSKILPAPQQAEPDNCQPAGLLSQEVYMVTVRCREAGWVTVKAAGLRCFSFLFLLCSGWLWGHSSFLRH
jgi:hypothetical protein